MRLFVFEVRKLLTNSIFLVGLALAVGANLFLLWNNTMVENNTIPADAYRKIEKDLRGLSLVEQKELVEQKLQLITGLLKIDKYLKSGVPQDNAGKAEYWQLLEYYGEVHSTKNYELYCLDINQEFYFLKLMQNELETVSNYDSFLDGVQTKAEQLGQISIFADAENTYDIENIELTAQAYKNISGIKITYSPQKGFVKATNFVFTDIVLIFSMLILASVIVREERDNGLLKLVRSTPAGRVRTAQAKMLTLFSGLLIIVTMLYVTNLIFCGAVYTLGDLNRSVQSIPEFMRCTLQLSAWQYLALFLFAKWIAACVLGAGVLLISIYAKKAITGWSMSLFLIIAQWFIRENVSAISNFNIIKYANIISILHTNEFIGTYRNLFFFGSPISLRLVESLTALVLFIAFLFAFVFVFSVNELSAEASAPLSKNTITVAPTSIFREENYKAFLLNGVGVVLAVFLLFQVYNGYTMQSYITPEEMYYQHYMQKLTGKFTDEKYEWLLKEYESFEPIYKLEAQYAAGEIGDAEYSNGMMLNYSLSKRMEVFNSILYDKFPYVAENPGTHIVYETGYLYLFDYYKNYDLFELLLSSLLVALSFSGIFAIEKRSGMFKLLLTTPLGREKTVKNKLMVSAIIALAITVASTIPRYWWVLRDYGMLGLFSPIKSILEYNIIPIGFSILSIVLFSTGCKFVACMAMGMITLSISDKAGNYIWSAFISSFVFCFPLLLTISGIENAKWLGFYTLYSSAQIITESIGIVIVFLFIVLTCGILWVCQDYLYSKYR